MTLRLDQSSVEELNLALRLYRRLLVRLPLILVLGFAGSIGLLYLGYALAPPYGLYIFGWGLETYGLLATLAALILELWWEGRQIGRALDDPGMQDAPIAGLLGATGVIAERARAMDMEWSGFYGPLRPARRR